MFLRGGVFLCTKYPYMAHNLPHFPPVGQYLALPHAGAPNQEREREREMEMEMERGLVAQIRQSRPGSGLGFQVKVLRTI